MNTTGRAIDDVSQFFVTVDSFIFIMFGCTIVSIATGYKLMDYIIRNISVDTSEIKRKRCIKEYEASYVDELEELETIPLTKTKSDGLMLLKHDAETPFGKVIMTYDVDAASFCYYTDSRFVPYKTLDAVARRFAVAHNCKCICVNYKEEWKKAKAAAHAEEEEELRQTINNKVKTDCNTIESSVETKERDVFAKFKSYNSVNHHSNHDSIDNKNRKDSIKRRKHRYVSHNSNRFTHKGRLSEYKLIDNTQSSNGLSGSSNGLSFAEFKQLEKKRKEIKSN